VWAYRAPRNLIPAGVYEACRQRGLADSEIAWLIDSTKNAMGDRATFLASFKATFKPEQDPALRMPCAEEVLDEAGN